MYGFIYTEQNYKRNTYVFAPIFHDFLLNKIINTTLLFLPPIFMIFFQKSFLCTQKTYFSQILFTNLSKSVLVSTSPLLRWSIHLTGVAYQDAD